MAKGFYVARRLAEKAIELMEAQTVYGSGVRFHPSIKIQKYGIGGTNETLAIPAMLEVVRAWARFDTEFFRASGMPVGDEMFVVSDSSGLVSRISIGQRTAFDLGISAFARDIYNIRDKMGVLRDQIDKANQRNAKHHAAGDPQKGVSDSAGPTISTWAMLQSRIADRIPRAETGGGGSIGGVGMKGGA